MTNTSLKLLALNTTKQPHTTDGSKSQQALEAFMYFSKTFEYMSIISKLGTFNKSNNTIWKLDGCWEEKQKWDLEQIRRLVPHTI
jgi:hypothetical protein